MPHPLSIAPQFLRSRAHVVGTHSAMRDPETFSTPPPPQVCGGLQVPHEGLPPQPSSILPQVL